MCSPWVAHRKMDKSRKLIIPGTVGRLAGSLSVQLSVRHPRIVDLGGAVGNNPNYFHGLSHVPVPENKSVGFFC